MRNRTAGRLRVVVAVVAMVWGAGCSPTVAPSLHPETNEAVAPYPVAVAETVRGTLRYFDLEGGFWGVVSDGGERLRVVGPAAPAWRDGARVAARVRRLPQGPSLHQWGEPIEVEDLRIEGSAMEQRQQ